MTATDDLFELFASRLTSVGGQAHQAATSNEAVNLIAEIAQGIEIIWASPTLSHHASNVAQTLQSMKFDVRFDGDPASVRDQPVGLTIARNAIAETGSCLLVEPTLGERAVSLMTQTLIVLCPASALLPSLDDAATVLREVSLSNASYATLVTGPSRTADIERQLTVGVQGPGVFHAIFVDDLS